jgi:hypothetical protein
MELRVGSSLASAGYSFPNPTPHRFGARLYWPPKTVIAESRWRSLTVEIDSADALSLS